VQVDELDLNRHAAPTRDLPKDAHVGFSWNRGDGLTAKWRPQGIAGYAKDRSKYLLVSWYGRGRYAGRGARVSFIDVSDIKNVKYRHVLLVDENKKTFSGLHAGGLAINNGVLHVADSRDAKNPSILTFDLSEILEIDPKNFYNYRYILCLKRKYRVDLKPSFVSFDRDSKNYLVGTFTQKPDPKGKVSWYQIEDGQVIMKAALLFQHEMQGAFCLHDENRLYISQSYGRLNKSKFSIIDYKLDGEDIQIRNILTRSYPVGLEDVYVSASRNVWLLTEFAGSRMVFATKEQEFK